MKLTPQRPRAGKKPGADKKKNAEKASAADKPVDALAPIVKSRAKERAEMLKIRQQLDKMIFEMQQRILASRAKFNAARWKMINKAMDD